MQTLFGLNSNKQKTKCLFFLTTLKKQKSVTESGFGKKKQIVKWPQTMQLRVFLQKRNLWNNRTIFAVHSTHLTGFFD